MKRLIIIGAGGHGRVIADIAERLGCYKEISFLDDAHIKKSGGYEVLGKTQDYVSLLQNSEFIVAIGNADLRNKIQNELERNNARMATLIHPSAVIGSRTEIGAGTAVMAGVVINCDVKIGKGVIINTSSSVDHDCVIGDFCHVSVGARLAGTVKLGSKCMIGAGAVVINNISVPENTVVAAGGVVVKSIEKSGTYMGIPAVCKK